MKQAKPAKIPESKVNREISKTLRKSHIKTYWRNNTGNVVIGKDSERRFLTFGVPGSSDWIGQIPMSGRLLAIEAKRPYIRGVQARGKLTEDQAKFLAKVNADGGVAICVDNAEVVEKVLSQLEQDPRAKFDTDGRCLVFWGMPVVHVEEIKG